MVGEEQKERRNKRFKKGRKEGKQKESVKKGKKKSGYQFNICDNLEKIQTPRVNFQ